MYVAMVFGIKDLLLIFFSILSSLFGLFSSLKYLNSFTRAEMLVPDFIVLLIWIALINRSPNAKFSGWKKIWINGRGLMFAAFLMQIALLLIAHLEDFQDLRINLIVIFEVILCVFFLGYLFVSPRVKGVFSDWPELKGK